MFDEAGNGSRPPLRATAAGEGAAYVGVLVSAHFGRLVLGCIEANFPKGKLLLLASENDFRRMCLHVYILIVYLFVSFYEAGRGM